MNAKISYKKYHKTKGFLFTFGGVGMASFYFITKLIDTQKHMESLSFRSIALFISVVVTVVLIIAGSVKFKNNESAKDLSDELYEATLAKTNKAFIKLLGVLAVISIFATAFFDTYKISSTLFMCVMLIGCGIYNFMAYYYEKQTCEEAEE